MIQKAFRLLGVLILISLLFLSIFILYSHITRFNPAPEIVLQVSKTPDTLKAGHTYNLMTWNIGYAGLGSNMDFFMDGGKRVRNSEARTRQNLQAINKFIENQDASFILLQEVDMDSRRSYYMNQVDVLGNQYFKFYGVNHRVSFVPIPVLSPIGQVHSGILTLSRYTPSLSVRIQYSDSLSFPRNLFDLRRCMVVNRFPVNNGKELILVNTHNSAFDDGSQRRAELLFIKDFVTLEYEKGNYVLVGGDWNQLPPGLPADAFGRAYESETFHVFNIDSTLFKRDWQWAYDPAAPTNRYLNIPYSESCKTVILDFFLASPNIRVEYIKTLNLNFENSDHNPVALRFKLKQQQTINEKTVPMQ